MGIFDRVEQKLERVVNGAFARAFKAEVQPVEIASAMRRAMDDRAAVIGAGRTVVPNVFNVLLAASDYERLTSYSDLLTSELLASVEEHAESQRYTPGGPFVVDFDIDDSLETGVFNVQAAAAKRPAPPRPIRTVTHQDDADERDHGAHHGHDHDVEHEDPARVQARLRAAARAQDDAQPAEDGIAVAGQAAAAAGGAMAGAAAAARMRRAHPPVPDVDHRATPDSAPHPDRAHPEAWDDPSEGDPWAPPGPSRQQHMRDDAERRELQEAQNAQRARDLDAWGDDEGAAADSYDQGFDEPLSQEPPHRPSPVPQHRTAAPAAPPPAPAAPPPARRPTVDASKRPWLEIDGDTYPLILALTSLGRDPGCDITLDDPGISRRHCELRVTHDGPHLVVTLRDLGSTNGTFVNGERVGSTRLTDGDRITLGRTSLTIRGTGR